MRKQFTTVPQGDAAIRFLEKLKLSGKKNGRICYYGASFGWVQS